MDCHWSNLGLGPYKNVAAAIVKIHLAKLKRAGTLTDVPQAKRAMKRVAATPRVCVERGTTETPN